MKVTGIIAEYNPFHNGHAYQISQAREETGADFIVAVMSGDFVQRGTPAIMEKHTRAHMALQGGADLVLELPVFFSTASAEFFAAGGISMFEQTGVVDTVCFGSEVTNPALYAQAADILFHEPVEYKASLRSELKKGKSFPAARESALFSYLVFLDTPLTESDKACLHDIMSLPNSILAMEYLKAIHKLSSPIRPHPIKRIGTGYHEPTVQGNYSSATALRKHMLSLRQASPSFFFGQGIPEASPLYRVLAESIPKEAYDVLLKYGKNYPFLHEDDFSTLLYYRLLQLKDYGFTAFTDSSPELSNRLRNQLFQFTGWTQFTNLLKTKNMTYTRLSRALLHILLNMRFKDSPYRGGTINVPYLKVLGVKKSAAALLSAIKEQGSAPLIIQPKEAAGLLAPDALNLYSQDIYASDIYRSVLNITAKKVMPNDYSHSTIYD